MPRRGLTEIGLARRTFLGRQRIGDQAGRVLEVELVVAGRDGGHALQRSAREDVRGPRRPRQAADLHLEVSSLQRLAEALAGGLGGEQHREVRGQRLEAAHLHHLHPGLRRRGVELVDHAPDERDLTREVHVVCAARHARLDHRAPVVGVGADQVQHHACARDHRSQRRLVGHVGHDGLRHAHPALPEHALRLGGIARGGRPARPALLSALGQISAHPAPRDAGSPEDHDVELALTHGGAPYRRSAGRALVDRAPPVARLCAAGVELRHQPLGAA